MKPLLVLLIVFAYSVLPGFSQDHDQVIITPLKANLRGTAATDGTVVTQAKRGEIFAVLMRDGQWYLVQTPEYVGWLHQTVVDQYSSDTKLTFSQLLKKYPEQKSAQTSNNSPRSEPTEPSNPNRLPLGSAPLGAGIKSGKSSLAVANGTDTDALVRVIKFGATEELVRNFYVPANESFTAEELPSGFYVLRVAFGRDWSDSEKRFNFRRSFSQTEMFEAKQTVSYENIEGGHKGKDSFFQTIDDTTQNTRWKLLVKTDYRKRFLVSRQTTGIIMNESVLFGRTLSVGIIWMVSRTG